MAHFPLGVSVAWHLALATSVMSPSHPGPKLGLPLRPVLGPARSGKKGRPRVRLQGPCLEPGSWKGFVPSGLGRKCSACHRGLGLNRPGPWVLYFGCFPEFLWYQRKQRQLAVNPGESSQVDECLGDVGTSQKEGLGCMEAAGVPCDPTSLQSAPQILFTPLPCSLLSHSTLSLHTGWHRGCGFEYHLQSH